MKNFYFNLQRFTYISNDKSSRLITTSYERDDIFNDGNFVTIKSGDGNDSIFNRDGNGDYSEIWAGKDNDIITNVDASYVLIQG